MAGILHITTVYRQGMSDDREAMKQLFQCEDAQKIACSVFLRYKKKLQYVDWDIVLTDAIVRYMERLIREKEHDVKPIEKPAAVFWLICNQICWKYLKMPGYGLPDEIVLETFTQLASIDTNPGLYEKSVRMLDQLEFPAGLLLFMNYLAEPPVKDYAQLFEALKAEACKRGLKLRVTSPEGIPNLLWHSRMKFRDFLKGRDDVDEFF